MLSLLVAARRLLDGRSQVALDVRPQRIGQRHLPGCRRESTPNAWSPN